MIKYKCTKELYKAFLEASIMRYSGLELSEVSPEAISHDLISCFFKDKNFTPKNIWRISNIIIYKEKKMFINLSPSWKKKCIFQTWGKKM